MLSGGWSTGQSLQIPRKAALSMTGLDERTAVVFDDQPLWLDALERLLAGAGVQVVARTSYADDVLALVEEHRPDVLVASADTRDGAGDTLACVERTRACHPSVKSVVLSASDDQQQIQAAFAAGASVYCVKRAAAADLVVAIRQAFDHSIYLAGVYTGELASSGACDPSRFGEAAELTRRELEILQLVAEGHSNSALAKMLWVTEQTVKFHLSNIYRKLNVSNRTEASRWAQLHDLLPQTPMADHAVA
jgi:DNA-binding NarL/FixJ family response regulator